MKTRPKLFSKQRSFGIFLIVALLSLLSANTASAQCPKGTADFEPDFDASTLTLGVRTQIATTTWGNEYQTANNMQAGCTYRIDACGAIIDADMTIFANGSTVALAYDDNTCGDDPQIDFVCPANGSYDFQVSQAPCGAYANNIPTFMTLVSCAASCSLGSITLNPVNQSVCPGATAVFTMDTVGGGGTVDSIRWFLAPGTMLSDVPPYSGTTTTSLTINPTTVGMNGNQYFAVIYGCSPVSSANSTSATLTVADAVNPTITCPGNQTGNVDASCNFSLPNYTSLATAADNCPGETVTQVPAPGTNVGVGTTNIVLTVTDGAGNTANCNFNVVVSDNTNPTITCPGNQVGSVDASCNFSLPDYTSLATAADNCPGETVTQVPAPGTNVGIGTTNIVLTVTDGAGNTANCNFNVVVSDNTNPTITCPGNQVGSVDASCNFSLPDYTSLATAADNCPGETVTQVPAPGTNVGAGTTNIVLTVTDGAGNTANCNFDVVVSDNTNPTITCPGNQVGSVDASCNFSLPDYTSLATAADNCPGETVTQVPAPGTNVGIGTTNIVLTVTDGAGNTANCNFDVVVSDNTNPTITCPGNQVGSVDASCNFSLPDYTSLATAADNCPGETVTQVPAPGTNVGIGTTNIVLTVTDGAGNTANCNFDVVVSDNTNPTITCPGNQVGSVDASCNFSLPDYTSLATAADNCPGETVTQVPAPGTNVGAGTTNIVLTVTDGAGNTANCNFDVVVSDNTNPTITCPGNQVGSVDASCNFSLPDYTSLATAADNCPGETVTQVPAPGTNVGIGTTNIVLTVTDGAGNTANCNFDVVVSDNTNPTITCPGNQVGSVDASCNFSLPDYTSLATAADNCPGETVTQVPAPGTNVGIGTTNIVLTVTDGAGNTANCNFDVVVSDNTNPTITCPGNQVGSVDASCNFSLPDYTSLATAADNCPGETVTQVPAPGTNVGAGTTNVVLTVTDGAGNTANCNFDVVVSDNTNPTAVCQNITVFLDGSGNATITAADVDGGSTDNCPGLTLSATPTAFTCANIGTNNVTLTVTDGNSNTDNCTATVTVQDTISPVVTCPGNQTENPGPGCTFTLPDYTGSVTATDNCGGTPTVTQSPVSGTVISGNTTITMTADDGNGNTSTCTFDVILNDNTNPTAVCQNITVYLDGAGNATITAADVDGGSTDNCGAVTLSATPTAFTCANIGTNSVTLTATDGNSNTDNCTATVTVQDTVSPVAVCQNITVFLDGAGNATITAGDVDGGSSDNCAIGGLSVSPSAFTCADLGANTVTLTVNDVNGNSSTCTATVTVQDTVSPVAVCANISVFLDGAGNATITGTDIDGGSTDNCGTTNLSVAPNAFTCADLGANNVTLTVDDGNGNTSTCVAVVTVQDTVSPTAVCQDITVYLDGAGSATITAADIDGGSTDNCGTVTLSASQTAFNCADIGSGPPPANDLIISGVYDGPLSGGTPKGVELYVVNDIADLSQYGLGSANNGGGSDGEEFTFPVVSATAGQYIYVASEAIEFTNWFGFAPDYTTGSMLINGDDAVELFYQTNEIDVFGDINVDGTGQPWEYLDGWAYRVSDTGPDGTTFTIGNWTFSGINALDLETSNATAATPVPIGTFTKSGGASQVTLTVDDGNGNTSTCIANVSVLDTISPVVTCPGNQTETPGPGCVFTLPDYTALAGATDNCTASLTITQSPAPGTVISGTTTIIMSTADESGNAGSCTFDVILVDNTNPTAVCQNINAYLDGAGTVTINAADLDGGSTDNCATLTFSASQTTFTCADLGPNNVTLTVTDGNSNTDNCTAVVTVIDTISPVANCANITAYLDGSGNVTITGADVDGGSTDNCGTTNLSVSPSTFTCAELGANNVTLTVDDGNGNSSTCVAVVTVQDTVSPVVSCTNVTVFLDGSGNATITAADVDGGTTDNCNPTPTLSVDISAFTCAELGANTVTLTADDGNGNTATCTAIVTVSDTVSPTAVCQNITAYVDGSGNVTINDADLDGGSTDNCGTVNFTAGQTAFTCADLGANNVTLTVDDGNGNTATCVAVVTVMDTISPVATCPGNQIENFDVNCQFTLPDYTSLVTATDNCGGTPTVTQSPAAGTVISGNATITMTADDGNGNTSTCTFDVIPNDATPPVAVCQNITIYLDGLGNATITAADVDGGSTDNCGTPTLSIDISAFTCAELGANNVTLTADDGVNTATCVAVVTVLDTIAPTITCPANDTVLADVNCEALLGDYTGMATAADVCDANPTITQSPAVGTTITGTTTVWLYATDASANVDSCSFTVTVADSTAPVITCPLNDTIVADANCESVLADYTGMVTVTDNCDANPTVVQSPAAGTTISGSGTVTTITMTATDANGNVASCTFDVVLADSTAPVITCANDTVYADGNCESILGDYTAGVTDNCDANPTVVQSPAAGTTLSGSGTSTTVTITATDADGNVAVCTFDVLLSDSTAPTLTCPPDETVNVNANCEFTVADYAALATVTDNCDAAPVVTQSPAAGSTASGNTTVTLTATDADGNTATCVVNVTVNDTIDPTISCPTDIVTCDPVVVYTVPVGTDNCTGATTAQTDGTGLTSGSTFPVGTTTLEYTVTDGAGNTAVCSFNVTVNANLDATFTYTQNGTGLVDFVANDQGAESYSWDFGDATSSTDINPSKLYDTNGSYVVCLTVFNNGCSATWCDTLDITVSLEELVQNNVNFGVFPNPFRAFTNITYELENNSQVMLRVLDINGREVTQLVNGAQAAGEYKYQFNAADYHKEAGVYLVQLVVDDQVYMLRMIELK